MTGQSINANIADELNNHQLKLVVVEFLPCPSPGKAHWRNMQAGYIESLRVRIGLRYSIMLMHRYQCYSECSISGKKATKQ